MTVVVITIAVMVAVTVNTTAFVVRLMMRVLLVISPTPIAGHTGDATTHQPNACEKLRFTKTMQPEKIAWGDRVILST